MPENEKHSAFLSWESARRVKNGEDDLRLIPSIIGGSPKSRRGVVLAKSIPAKQFNFKTGEPIGMALRKCPSLMIAPPDFKLYAACSKAFKDICRAYAPVVEEFSIDECFLDFTGTEHIYPNPIALAYEIKDKIRGELGFTVNVGSTFKDIDYTAENGEQKTICNRIVYAMTELTSAPNGQMFLVPEYEVNMFWTNLGDSDDEIINLYHAHGECEQFHSEIKTDMGVERLPSGKFDTNELVLELTLIAYNILRMLGQETVSQGKAPVKRAVHRRRLRTVIQNIVNFAGHVTKHARQLILSISRSNAWAAAYLGLTAHFTHA